jgi:NAD(P)H dehydrogenase (quinone)
MKRVILNIFGGFITILVSAQVPGSSIGFKDPEQVKTTVLVVYYSASGNTEKMAQAVASGAQKVPTVKVLVKTPEKVTDDDLKTADAIILGSPTYYGNMSAQMKTFIDDWFLKYKTSLVNKVGAAFSTGGDESGGKEHVLYSLVIAMMNAGMIIVGPVEGFLGTVGVAAMDPVNETALKKAGSLGERVANIAQQLKNGKK